MGIFNWKKKKQHNNLDDDKRELALITRKMNAELKEKKQEIELMKLESMHELETLKLQKQKLELQSKIYDLEDQFADDEEEEEPKSDNMAETLLMSILTKSMQSNGEGATSTQPNPLAENISAPSLVSLSDDEIKEYISNYDKKDIKKLKGLPVPMLKHLAKDHPEFSTFDSDTLERAIKILKA